MNDHRNYERNYEPSQGPSPPPREPYPQAPPPYPEGPRQAPPGRRPQPYGGQQPYGQPQQQPYYPPPYTPVPPQPQGYADTGYQGSAFNKDEIRAKGSVTQKEKSRSKSRLLTIIILAVVIFVGAPFAVWLVKARAARPPDGTPGAIPTQSRKKRDDSEDFWDDEPSDEAAEDNFWDDNDDDAWESAVDPSQTHPIDNVEEDMWAEDREAEEMWRELVGEESSDDTDDTDDTTRISDPPFDTIRNNDARDGRGNKPGDKHLLTSDWDDENWVHKLISCKSSGGERKAAV